MSFHKELVRMLIAIIISGLKYLDLVLIDGQPNRQHSPDSRYREQVLTAASHQRCMQTRVGGS